MTRRIICFFLLCLFFLSNTALATNWKYVTESVDDGLTTTYYVDSDSASKEAELIRFWVLMINDKPELDLFGAKKSLAKVEARPLEPRAKRVIEIYMYDVKGETVVSSPPSGTAQWFDASKIDNKLIDMAQKYARKGRDSEQKPTP